MFGRPLIVSVLGLGLAACGPKPLEPRDPTPGVAHFRFVTYNVHFPAARDPSIIAAIRATNGDVVCLQETNPAWTEALSAELPDDYPYMVFQPLEGADGLGILSRFPLVDYGLLPRLEGWHPAWHVTVETPAGPVEVLNLHLRAMFDRSGNPIKSLLSTGSDHVNEVETFSASLDSTLPRVELGDFNEGVNGHSVAYLEGRGFQNALPLYHPGQPTWIGASVGDQLEMTVDHVLFDAHFESLNAFVIDSGDSDHLPVVAHLEATDSWGGAP
jgi:endonuclease/exonuclease/phosphatase family metal-dependent hydrolase